MEESINMRDMALKRLNSLDGIISRSASTLLRQQILDEVQFFQQDYSREMRRRANACTPLLRLPPEIIRAIASHLVEIWSPNIPHCFTCPGPPSIGWLTLSHICSTLRTILLKHQHLWARAMSTFPVAQEELFLRAGTTPVFFDFKNYSKCDHQKMHFKFFMKHLCRSEEIHFTEFYGENNHWLLDPAIFVGREFPSLSKLHIRKEYTVEQFAGFIFELPMVITPSLRHLMLCNFIIPFDGQTLSYLNLECTDWEGREDDSYPPASWLLDILRRCTNLEFLRLSGYIRTIQDWDLNKPDPVDRVRILFPLLTSMEIEDLGNYCQYLDAYLYPPLRSSVTYILHDIDESDALSGLFGRHFRFKANALGPLSLSIDSDRRKDQLTLNLLSSSGPGVSLFSLQILGLADAIDSEMAIENICGICANGVDQLEFFDHVYGPYNPFTEESWRSFLQPLSQVKKVHVNASTAALWSTLTVHSASTALLPALTQLSITIFERYGDATDDATNMLLSRRRAGMPIQHLLIEELDLPEIEAHHSFLPRLRALVPHVECRAVHSSDED